MGDVIRLAWQSADGKERGWLYVTADHPDVVNAPCLLKVTWHG